MLFGGRAYTRDTGGMIWISELAVSFIQAYVLTILTCSYIKDAVELH